MNNIMIVIQHRILFAGQVKAILAIIDSTVLQQI